MPLFFVFICAGLSKNFAANANAKKYLREHPEVANEIDAKIREKVLKSAMPLELSEPENFDDAEDFEDDKEN